MPARSFKVLQSIYNLAPIFKFFLFRHNEDGSYTYGYEAADGTFKLETRFLDGSVQGREQSD